MALSSSTQATANRTPREKVSLVRRQAVNWLSYGLKAPPDKNKHSNSSNTNIGGGSFNSSTTSPPLLPGLDPPPTAPPSMQKLNPIDEENPKTVLQILHELAAGDASLDDLASLAAASSGGRSNKRNGGDADRKEWQDVVSKLLLLRTQIVNRDVFDACIGNIAGATSWERYVEGVTPDSTPMKKDRASIPASPIAEDGVLPPSLGNVLLPPSEERRAIAAATAATASAKSGTQPQSAAVTTMLVAIGDTPPPEELPEDGIVGSDEEDSKPLGAPSPIGVGSSPAAFPSTPPLNPETPEFIPASERAARSREVSTNNNFTSINAPGNNNEQTNSNSTIPPGAYSTPMSGTPPPASSFRQQSAGGGMNNNGVSSSGNTTNNGATTTSSTSGANKTSGGNTGAGNNINNSASDNTASSTPAQSPVVRSYHLETREEMLSRHQRARNGSLNSSITTLNGSRSAYPPLGGGNTPPPDPRTPPLGSMGGSNRQTPRSSPMLGPSMMSPLSMHLHHQQLMHSVQAQQAAAVAAGQPPPHPSPLCAWDYLLVVDFEATCDEPNPPNYYHEIIEFPVVVVEVASMQIVAEFQSYVRPVKNPVLSPFCVNLTGIQQRDVEHAPVLQEVVDKFERWFKHAVPQGARCVIATDGPWDMRDFMYNYSVRLGGVTFPQLFFSWVDIKQTFAQFFGCQRGKIRPMLDALGIPFEGRLHSGIDDARNIAKIAIGLLQRGCSFEAIESMPYAGPPTSIDD